MKGSEEEEESTETRAHSLLSSMGLLWMGECFSVAFIEPCMLCICPPMRSTCLEINTSTLPALEREIQIM